MGEHDVRTNQVAIQSIVATCGLVILATLPNARVDPRELVDVNEAKSIKDCGPRCIRYLSRYYARPISLEQACKLCNFTEDHGATNMLELKHACEALGLHCFGLRGPPSVIREHPFEQCSFVAAIERPELRHFMVIAKAKQSNAWLGLDPTTNTAYALGDEYFKSQNMNSYLAVSDKPISAVAGAAEKSKSSTACLALLIFIACGFAAFELFRKMG
jgi:ABC-type bacteriocin/lantibiotic exporter with double-glycine peptidase domain